MIRSLKPTWLRGPLSSMQAQLLADDSAVPLSLALLGLFPRQLRLMKIAHVEEVPQETHHLDDELEAAYSKLLLTKAEICKDIAEAQDRATLAKVVEAKSRCDEDA